MRWKTYLPRIYGEGPEAQGDSMSAEESAIVALMQAHPEQRRKEIYPDRILCQVAHARALDMATRGYLSHTDPDGNGPDFLVEQAGL